MNTSRSTQVSSSSADLRSRLALAGEPKPRDAGGPPLRRLLAETQVIIEPIRRLTRNLEIPVTEHPRKVMLLPGFATHPIRMRYMARQPEKAGHKVKRWGLGFNFGPTVENFEILGQRLDDLHRRYQEPVYLVGWSLGGLFARELARRNPEKVARVVTMGSPFSGSPRANNAWRIYQFVTGHSVDYPPIEGDQRIKPPVFTTALWSPRDGIISPRSACGKPGERDRAVALRCTHLGFAYSDESIRAVLQELEEE